jgi:hypothetical protein
MSAHNLLATIAAAGAVALTGCGLSDPYATQTRREKPPAARVAVAPAQQAASGGRSAIAILRRFALAWSTWDAHSLPARRAQLARLADGPLAHELAANSDDATSAAQATTSRGRFVGALPQGAGSYAVVLEETASTAGTGQQRGYNVYLTTLTATRDGSLKVSGWQPTS